MKNKISLFLKLFISVAIFFILFKLVPYKELLEIYKHSCKIYIFFSFLAFFATLIISIFRWRFLLASLNVHVKKREAFSATFSGLFFNLIFPSFIAGDIFKGFSISSRHGETKKVASTIILDRFSGSFALVIVALVSFIFGRKMLPQKQVFSSLILLCSAIGFFSLIIFSKRFFSFFAHILKDGSSLKNKIVSFHDQLYFFRKNPAIFLKSMFFSLPIQLLTPIMFFIAAKAFGVNISIMYFFILVPIIMMIALIPVTIAGAGTREAASIYFFSLIGIEKSVGLSISLLNLAFNIFLGLLGGFFYVSIHHRRIQPHP